MVGVPGEGEGEVHGGVLLPGQEEHAAAQLLPRVQLQSSRYVCTESLYGEESIPGTESGIE